MEPQRVDLTDLTWQRILTVRPGYISYAIITLARSYNGSSTAQKQQLELDYIRRQSTLLDLRIIAAALHGVLITRGNIKLHGNPKNEQRQILNDSLQRAVEELRKLDPSFMIYVDGSYVTSKVEPNDVDLLIKTDRYLETEIQQHLHQVCPVEAVSLDVNVESTAQAYLLDFLMTDDYGQDKGILQVI